MVRLAVTVVSLAAYVKRAKADHDLQFTQNTSHSPHNDYTTTTTWHDINDGKEETEQSKGSTRCNNPLTNQLPPSSSTHSPPPSSTTLPHNKQSSHEEDDAETVLPPVYVYILMISDPKLKRLICRRCSALLSPQTGNVMTRLAETKGGNGDEMLEIECCHCGTKRRFNMSQNFTLYSEREPIEVTQIH